MNESRKSMPIARATSFVVDCGLVLSDAPDASVDDLFEEVALRIKNIRVRTTGGIVKGVRWNLGKRLLTVTLNYPISSNKFSRLMRDCEEIVESVIEEFADNDDAT